MTGVTVYVCFQHYTEQEVRVLPVTLFIGVISDSIMTKQSFMKRSSKAKKYSKKQFFEL